MPENVNTPEPGCCARPPNWKLLGVVPKLKPGAGTDGAGLTTGACGWPAPNTDPKVGAAAALNELVADAAPPKAGTAVCAATLPNAGTTLLLVTVF